jgi:hypothetical protein
MLARKLDYKYKIYWLIINSITSVCKQIILPFEPFQVQNDTNTRLTKHESTFHYVILYLKNPEGKRRASIAYKSYCGTPQILKSTLIN